MSKYAPHGRSTNRPRATPSTICQKCLKTGHFIYECKSSRPYVSRPSRTQQLENPKLLAKLKAEGKPSVEVPEEFKTKTGTANKILELKEKERLKSTKDKEEGPSRKRVKRSSSSSSSSSSSDSETSTSSTSESDSDSDSDSYSSSSSESVSRQSFKIQIQVCFIRQFSGFARPEASSVDFSRPFIMGLLG
ncbi:putative zinc knuckle [Lyophyllum shimeji]|uniref:Zinc knuckle n=1 Tax=Lyophyllum shimeji TaxID=47721 RepID=A0A9P3UMP4_LYOSH|nr:putative zinc knuckle [Lyophyllum shimeji]